MLDDGKNIIFLLSLPRSGSTLLQRILSKHAGIKTESETWLMLHPLYALKQEGHTANYNEVWAFDALKNFLATLPDGEAAYLEGLRRMFDYVYSCALEGSNESYFLDKTPRYYEIIPELAGLFPAAKFVVLLRNPLAVLNSRVELLGAGGLEGLRAYSRDIFEGPKKLFEGLEVLDDKACIVRYEDLVENPANEVSRLCGYLNIDYSSDLLEYNVDQGEWAYGDPDKIYKNSRPNSSYKDAWEGKLANPQLWRIYNEYFNALGPALFDQMGYSSKGLRRLFHERPAGKLKLLMSKSLQSLFD